MYLHRKHFHCSKDIIFAEMSKRYYLLHGYNNIAKGIICNCVWCRRIRGITASQIMGQLPRERITIARKFSTLGVDFTGHFNVKCLNHRSAKTNKAHAAIFVCFVTRAVHLEIISNLSTAMFLQGLARLCAHRGKPNC